MGGYELSDERLAWLAMRDYCQKRSNKGIVKFLMRFMGGGNASYNVRSRGTQMTVHTGASGARAMRNELTSGKMMDYSIAVDTCSQRLSDKERQLLRTARKLPEWFTAAVEAEMKTLRPQR